jgi:hypothetical protein
MTMKALIARYLNEVVSLTVMALMVVALIAGQAGAMGRDAIHRNPEFNAVATIRTVLDIRLEREK